MRVKALAREDAESDCEETGRKPPVLSSQVSVFKLVLSSGIVAAGLALWGSLLGLLYRLGWLSVFGVSQDLFIPSSGTELTYWGYIALLEAWIEAQRGFYGWWTRMLGLFVAAGLLGFVVGLLLVKNKAWLDGVLRHRTAKLSLEATTFFGQLALYPVVIFVAASALLLLPFPAYSLAQRSAQSAILKYQSEMAQGRRNCHKLTGTAGQIGTCPMVIAQSAGRLAFLDGSEVRLIPSEGVQIQWTLPVPHENTPPKN